MHTRSKTRAAAARAERERAEMAQAMRIEVEIVAAERLRILGRRTSSEEAQILKFDDISDAAQGASSSTISANEEKAVADEYLPTYHKGLKEAGRPECHICKESINKFCLKCKAELGPVEGDCKVEVGVCGCRLHSHCVHGWRQSAHFHANCPLHSNTVFETKEII